MTFLLLLIIVPYSLFSINELLRFRAMKRLRSSIDKYTLVEFENKIRESLASEIGEYNLIQGWGYYYRYNKHVPIISIKRQNQYDNLDFAIVLHEFGHYEDSKCKGINRLYKLMNLVVLNRILLLPLLLIHFFVSILRGNATIEYRLMSILVVTNYILAFYKAIVGSVLEWRASSIALKRLQKNSNAFGFVSSVHTVFIYSLLNQLFMTLSWIAIVMSITYYLYDSFI